jgi:hypothetical protein
MLQDLIVYIIILLAVLRTVLAIWDFFRKNEKATTNYSGCKHCTINHANKLFKNKIGNVVTEINSYRY